MSVHIEQYLTYSFVSPFKYMLYVCCGDRKGKAETISTKVPISPEAEIRTISDAKSTFEYVEYVTKVVTL